MIIKTRCICDHINETSVSKDWIEQEIIPIFCSNCKSLYIATSCIGEEIGEEISKENEEINEEITEEITANLNISDNVIVTNKKCEFYNKKGVIIDKDISHCKIKFKFNTIWLPNNWVKKYTNILINTIVIMILIFALIGFVDLIKFIYDSL